VVAAGYSGGTQEDVFSFFDGLPGHYFGWDGQFLMATKEEKAGSAAGAAVAAPKEKTGKPAKKLKPGQLPPYHVILLNDDDHSFDYVIEMLKVLFAHPEEKGYEMAAEVDREGRVIVLTTHKEMAELKRDQIHAYGADIRVATCKGSMSATIEPAE
jgi:ATP-dependent Clp protease adaptor protein ClpS